MGYMLITYLAIKHRLKKQKEQEPFFQLPLYKKIFLHTDAGIAKLI